METLEERCIPNAAPLSAGEQYFLELVNRARLDPVGEAQRFGIDLNEGLAAGTISTAPKQPLVANDQLLSAIEGHLNDMLSKNYFSHTGSDGSSPFDRIEAAGYTNFANAGENLGWSSDLNADLDNVEELHRLLFVDSNVANRGHRTQILNGNYREVGIGLVSGFGSVMGGQDFGTKPDTGAFLTGVAFSDIVRADSFYTPGEGLGGVSITAISANGQKFTTTTGNAGGYSLALPNGTYTVTFASSQLPNGGTSIQDVNVSSRNVKVDLPVNGSAGVTPKLTGTSTSTNAAEIITPTTPTNIPVTTTNNSVATPATTNTNTNTQTFVNSSSKRVFAGADQGSAPIIRVFSEDGQRIAEFMAFESTYKGGVRLASGDVNGDGAEDIIAVPGSGRVSEVRIFDGNTFGLIKRLDGFEATFGGGLYVTSADFTGDGRADIAISADEGGGARIRVYDGASNRILADFFGIEDANFRGGARIGAGDINGDGIADLAVGAGIGGGPRLAIFDGASLAGGRVQKVVSDFFVFEQTLRNGVYLSLGDLNNDGKADLVIGGGPGGGPRVFALDGAALARSNGQDKVTQANFFAGSSTDRGGVRVAVKDVNGDGNADIITGAGTGSGLGVTSGKALTTQGNAARSDFNGSGLSNGLGGVFVG